MAYVFTFSCTTDGFVGLYFGYKHEGASYVDVKGTKDRSQFYNVSSQSLGVVSQESG